MAEEKKTARKHKLVNQKKLRAIAKENNISCSTEAFAPLRKLDSADSINKVWQASILLSKQLKKKIIKFEVVESIVAKMFHPNMLDSSPVLTKNLPPKSPDLVISSPAEPVTVVPPKKISPKRVPVLSNQEIKEVQKSRPIGHLGF